jgi:hypothetical protein
MFFWHVGATIWLFRWIFRDPKVDIRYLVLGALLPDLIDLPIGTVVLADRYATGELWFHSLLAPTLYMSIVLLATSRGRARRAWMALGVGWLLHLLLDGVWVDREVFGWPFFGFEIPVGESQYWEHAWERAFSDPWRWVKEALGMGYLVWLWIGLGLGDADRRTGVRRTGRLPDHVAS